MRVQRTADRYVARLHTAGDKETQHMRRTAMLFSGLLLTAATLAACGGDDGGGELSAADFKKQTEGVCESAGKKAGEIFKEFDGEDDDQLDEAANKYADLMREIADDLREVGYPEGKEDQANEFYDTFDDVADKLEDDPELLNATDEDLPPEIERLDELEKELDLESCGDVEA
jgi:hypothetical protein